MAEEVEFELTTDTLVYSFQAHTHSKPCGMLTITFLIVLNHIGSVASM